MKFNLKLRLLSGVLCAAVLWTPLTASAAETGGSSPSKDGISGTENRSWSALEEDLLEATEDVGSAEYDGYIIKMKPKASGYAAVYAAGGEDGIEELSGKDGLYTAEDLQSVQEFVRPEDVEYIEPNYIVSLFDSDRIDLKEIRTDVSGSENDAHLAMMNADTVRDEYLLTGEDQDTGTDMGGDGNPQDQIVVAVIDSGLDPDHKDIDYSHVLAGENFADTDSDDPAEAAASASSTEDTLGHGTFAAGEILATAGNGLGIDGIADDLYVMPLKAFSAKTASVDNVIRGIKYAVKQKKTFDQSGGQEGANICVLNMSLGTKNDSQALESAVNEAIDAGMIVVCAAGNDGDTEKSYPAQYAIGVGSTDAQGQKSNYSQILSADNGIGWENKVWVVSPGGGYTSLWYTGGYYRGSGTSFACPQVSALAALAVSLKNDLSSCYAGQTDYDGNAITTNHGAFRQLLKDAAKPLDSKLEKAANGQDPYYGWGMTDFEKAVDLLTGCDTGKGNPSAVSFSVSGRDGAELTAAGDQLSVSVKSYQEDGTLSATEESANADGVYTLKIGQKYSCTVSVRGYYSVQKDFAVLTPSKEILISMEEMDYYTSFAVTDLSGNPVEDISATVQKEDGQQVAQNTDGTFTTKNGNYTYSISADGHLAKAGSFTVDGIRQEYPDQKNVISVTLPAVTEVRSITLSAVAAGSGDADPQVQICVTDEEGNPQEIYGDGTWKLPPGTYHYTVSAEGYQTATGTFTVGTEDIYDEILLEKDTGSTGGTGGTGGGSTSGGSGGTSGGGGTGSSGGDSDAKHSDENRITVESGGHGTVNVDPQEAEEGEEVTVTVVPDDGYLADTLTVQKTDGTAVTAEDRGDGTYTFVMPDGKVTVNVTWKSQEIPQETPETGSAVFDDVRTGAWYGEAVDYVVSNGYFNGVSSTLFDPEGTMTRAMFVTAAGRLAGVDESEYSGASFADVPEGKWYSAYVKWASDNGVVNGVGDGSFDPDGEITREQMAALLYRYAQYAGIDVTPASGAAKAFASFPDSASVSDYAREAMIWAVGAGVISGSDGKLLPQEDATRAQVAQIIMNFSNRFVP